MKKFLVAALASLLALTAFAHECEECDKSGKPHCHALFFENNRGGLTIITDRTDRCGSVKMMDGYAFSSTNEYVEFCWIPRGDAVLVKFPDMEPGIWPSQAFKPLYVEPDVSHLKK